MEEENLEKFGMDVTYLNPSSLTPNMIKSKMGGQASYHLDENVSCKYCNEKLCLILEIFKSDFEEFYFPENFDYAQISTCYNDQCTGNENFQIEFYLTYGDLKNLQLNKEKSNTHIPSVYLNPVRTYEIPYQTYETDEQLSYKNQMPLEAYEDKIEPYTAKVGTKLNGDVFSWHGFDIPKCSCGNKKAHILQISTYEPCIHPNEKRPYYEWDSSIGVFVGNCGNYHFFVCKKCGLSTLEGVVDSM